MELRLEPTADDDTSLAWNSRKRIAGMVIALTEKTWLFIPPTKRDGPFIGTDLDEGMKELERLDRVGE